MQAHRQHQDHISRSLQPTYRACFFAAGLQEKEQRRLDAIKERERKNEEKKREREEKKRCADLHLLVGRGRIAQGSWQTPS